MRSTCGGAGATHDARGRWAGAAGYQKALGNAGATTRPSLYKPVAPGNAARAG